MQQQELERQTTMISKITISPDLASSTETSTSLTTIAASDSAY